jgi:hypothetical protein
MFLQHCHILHVPAALPIFYMFLQLCQYSACTCSIANIANCTSYALQFTCSCCPVHPLQFPAALYILYMFLVQ